MSGDNKDNPLFFKQISTIRASGSNRIPCTSLAVSHKYGVIVLSIGGGLHLAHVDHILSGVGETKDIGDIFKTRIPSNVLVSTEDILAVGVQDTVFLFTFPELLKDIPRALATIKLQAQVSQIAFNPTDPTMVAILSSDGNLRLNKIGPQSLQTFAFNDAQVKCICFSPKGKQLCVGHVNGQFSQLKLDLTVAKKFPGPGPTPVSLLWIATTQFMALVRDGADVCLYQIDLVKGGPPTLLPLGDVFISDLVNDQSQAYFSQLNPETIICSASTSSEIVALTKSPTATAWTVADIEDSRRACLPIDNYSAGGVLIFNHVADVVFSESESYAHMPVYTVASQWGVLSSFSIVNKGGVGEGGKLTQSQQLNWPTQAPSQLPPQPGFTSVPQQLAMTGGKIPLGIPAAQSQTTTVPPPFVFSPFASTQPQPFQTPAQTAPLELRTLPQATISPHHVPITPPAEQPVKQEQQTVVPTTQAPIISHTSEVQRDPGTDRLRKLSRGTPSSKLPTEEEVEQAKAQIQPTDSCSAELLKQFEDLQIRMRNFREVKDKFNKDLKEKLTRAEDEAHREISKLKKLEDFNKRIEKTCGAQRNEINLLRDKSLMHYSQVYYAKSLEERNRDPKYLQILRSQPMDPSTLKNMRDTQHKATLLRNQIQECRRSTYYSKCPPLSPSETRNCIKKTLATHSLIIKRLAQEHERIKRLFSKEPRNDSDLDELTTGFMKTSIRETGSTKEELSKGTYEQIRDYTCRNKVVIKLKTGRAACTPGYYYPNKIVFPVPTADLKFKTKAEIVKDLLEEGSSSTPTPPPVLPPLDKGSDRNQNVEEVIAEASGKLAALNDNSTREKVYQVGRLDVGSPSIFGQTPTLGRTRSSTPLIFGSIASTIVEQPATTTTAPAASVFGQVASATTTTTSSLLGQVPPSKATTTSSGALFGLSTTPALEQATSTTTPLAVEQLPPVTAAVPSLLGKATTTPTFAQSIPASTIPPVFGQITVTTTSPPSIFGQTPAATTTTAVTTPLFGHLASSPSLFGLPPLATTSASSPSIFGQTPTLGRTRSSTPLIFGSIASTVVEQPTTTTTVPAASVFGQVATPKTTTTSSLLGQAPTVTATTTSSGTVLFGLSTATPALPEQATSTTTTPLVVEQLPPVTTVLLGQATTTTTPAFPQSIPASTTPPVFGQITVTTTSPPSIFGQTPAATTTTAATPPLFGQLGVSASSPSVFGQPAGASPSIFSQLPSVTTATPSIFGQQGTTVTPTVGSTSTTSIFGQQGGGSGSPSIFGQQQGSTATTPSSPSIFGQAPTAPTTPSSIFGQIGTPSTASGTSSIFGQPATSTGTGSIFGKPAAGVSAFGQTLAATPSIFGQQSQSPAGTTPSIFGGGTTGASPTSPFGQQGQTTSVFGGSPSVFGQSPSSPTTAFGQPAPATPQKSIFGQSASVFGQTSPSVFGQASTFGQLATATTTPSSSPFGGSPFGGGSGTSPAFGKTVGNIFGGSGSTFSGGGVASGGSSGAFGQPAAVATPPDSLFGSTAFSGLGSSTGQAGSSAGGIFSGGTTFGQSNTTAASIFGGKPFGSTSPFGQQQPQAQGTFGSAAPSSPSSFGSLSSGANTAGSAVFGAAPVFGSTPVFGSVPFSSTGNTGFGSGSGGGSIFGGASIQQGTIGFGQLAQQQGVSNTPFQQSSGFGFASQQQQQQPQQQPQQQQQQSSGFGGSSFSSWR